MKKRIRIKRKNRNPISVLFVVGFLLGVLVPNLMWRQIYAQADIVSTYLTELLGDLNVKDRIYLFDVIRKRGGIAVITAVMGMSIFGIPLSMWAISLQAFEFGSILTCSILQFGIQGGLIGMALLFPHGLLYFTGMFGICHNVFQKSAETWKNDNIFNKCLYSYWIKMFVFGLSICMGIILEVYGSPIFIKFILKNFEIFP